MECPTGSSRTSAFAGVRSNTSSRCKRGSGDGVRACPKREPAPPVIMRGGATLSACHDERLQKHRDDRASPWTGRQRKWTLGHPAIRRRDDIFLGMKEKKE